MELLLVSLASLLLLPVALFTTGPLRIALGLCFVLFLPGYALIAALFPRKDDLGGVERLALSFGLSLAVVPLIGLALNYSPWGIRLLPILLSLTLFIVSMSGIAYYRRHKLAPEDRYEPQLRLHLSSHLLGWRSQSRGNRILTAALLLAIVAALGALAYAIATPKVGERFTEFYVLGSGEKAEGYPREVTVGDEAKVKLGVVNSEHDPVVYRITITVDGEEASDIGPINLEHGEKWEEWVSVLLRKEGPNQKVEFLLYKGEASEPYRTLHLWVNVVSASSP